MGGRPLDDRELVERAKRGEVDAYEQLVLRYQGIAQRTAFLVTGNAGDAEEAAQEAFIKAFYALDRFRQDASFKPWILKIVVNEARNRRRRNRRQSDLALRVQDERRSGDAVPSPETAFLVSEERGFLLEAVNGLSERDREAITMRYFLDLSEAEMAEVLGCRRGTVKSRLSRAMSRLRARLESRSSEDLAISRWVDKQ